LASLRTHLTLSGTLATSGSECSRSASWWAVIRTRTPGIPMKLIYQVDNQSQRPGPPGVRDRLLALGRSGQIQFASTDRTIACSRPCTGAQIGLHRLPLTSRATPIRLNPGQATGKWET